MKYNCSHELQNTGTMSAYNIPTEKKKCFMFTRITFHKNHLFTH